MTIEELSLEQFGLLMELLEGKQPIRVLSYGEGEMAFMFDREPGSTREIYSDAMREELLQAMEWSKRPHIYMTALLDPETKEPSDERFNERRLDIGLELKPFRDAKVFYTLIRGIYERNAVARESVLSFIR